MSQQQKLEKVLDLLLNEDSEKAAEILHQIIVEKARVIYESIVDEEEGSDEGLEEEDDEAGGDPDEDFTAEISSDEDDIESDEENGGEPESEDDGVDAEFGDEEGDFDSMSTEDQILDLKDDIEELQAMRDDLDKLLAQEYDEPNHDGLEDEIEGDDEFGGEDDQFGEVEPEGDDEGMPDFGGPEEKVVGEVVATMFEKKARAKLGKAREAKKGEMGKLVKGKKVDEETAFLTKVADTGQRGTAKLVGTGKGMTLGAEQTKSSFTNVPARKDYGGKPAKIGGGTGGEYGKYHGTSAKDDTPTDNISVEPKKSSIKADTTAKYTGGKSAGEGFNKSPLSKKPRQ